MKASALVPGISAYPEMEKNLQVKLNAIKSNCPECERSKLALKFRAKLQIKLQRDNVGRGV